MYFRNKDLRALNTFGLPGIADNFFEFTTETELISFLKGAGDRCDALILGGGSNILFTGDYHGLVIHPRNEGIYVEERAGDHAVVKVSAGVLWDDFVAWACLEGLVGVENLSMIPGSAGASAVQNIGAYGSEASESITKVRFVSLDDMNPCELDAGECHFGYRESIFKKELRGKAVVTSVWFRLLANHSFNVSYPEVAAECDRLGGISLINIRNAVMTIRKRKLPDPAVTGNAGSFFKNPVVTTEHYEQLVSAYPAMPGYRTSSGEVKLSAGWMIERCGWKGTRRGDAGVHPGQALVLVNYGNATGRDIISLAEEIKASVHERFGVSLVPEVVII